MNKVGPIKGRKRLGPQNNRFLPNNQNTSDNYYYDTTSSNYLITIKPQKDKRTSEQVSCDRHLKQRNTKIKFITEQIQKSTHDLLQVRTKSHQKQNSMKISSQNIEDENAYEICRSNKRSRQKGDKEEKKSSDKRSNKGGINMGNIKNRKQKSHSKEHLKLNFKSPTRKRGNKSDKRLSEASQNHRKSLKKLQNRQFLSPDIVKQQNSYYFSNEDESESKQRQNVEVDRKKELKYIFESKQSIWHEKPKKQLINSIFDPLADY